MITKHIADLLYYHECVIIPGFGGFLKAYKPAKIIHATHEFFPPSATLAFNGGLSGNDGLLASHIASVENIPYREAYSEIKQWVNTCLEALNRNDKVVIEGIGEFFMNASGKIEFVPSFFNNFNADSFGLPVFSAKAVNPEGHILPEIQQSKHIYSNTKIRRLIPETLKWAAVLGPFIAFALWGSLNGNIVNNYVHNYTGMYSWVRSTPGKTATVKMAEYTPPAEVTASDIIQSPLSMLANKNIPFDPATVSYAELAKNNITIADTTIPAPLPEIQDNKTYYIVGGAFRDHNNALKLIIRLSEQGYPASVVDTTSGGLYIVSMKGFDNYSEAAIQLEEVKKAGFTTSWILKKHKSQV